MKSAGKGGVFDNRLQMLHVHVFFVAPLGAGYIAETCTDQHERRIPIGKAADHTSAPANLPV